MLTVEINSFSFLRGGIPEDTSGHGGGFVFDCRFLPNPGRFEPYKKLNGKDKEVIEFLENEQAVHEFAALWMQMIEKAVEKYEERGFEHLSVSFGCTGGQHRSVYFAEKCARFIGDNFSTVKVKLKHVQRELEGELI
jgi:RNase adaptor protein for sRNA GlmZ degradation